jgi:threonine dehydratase
VEVQVSPTLADGLAGNLDPEAATFQIVQELVPDLVTVSEDEIRSAMQGIVQHERLVAEGAGAVGVAALLAKKIGHNAPTVAIVLSGANVDPHVLRSIL